MKTPFCEVYVARGFCRLKPLETRPNVCLTIITRCSDENRCFPCDMVVGKDTGSKLSDLACLEQIERCKTFRSSFANREVSHRLGSLFKWVSAEKETT